MCVCVCRENDVLKEQLKMMVKQRASSVRLDDSTMGKPL